MKKQIVHLILATLVAAAPIALSTGCAVAQHKETAGAYAKDKEIAARIKADLYKDHDVKGTEVKVESLNGVVQLSGFVESQTAKQRAEQIARSIPGVVEVHNDLLLPTGR
jgi:hyperosmotically inducible protein